MRRKILAWYSRFDVMGGLMSGYQTVLGREWFVASEKYYRQESLSYPNSISKDTGICQEFNSFHDNLTRIASFRKIFI